MAHSESQPSWNIHTQAEMDLLWSLYREREYCDRIHQLETAVRRLEQVRVSGQQKGTE